MANEVNRQQALLEQARSRPGVSEIMDVYRAAAERAPMIRPVPPAVRFSTTANS